MRLKLTMQNTGKTLLLPSSSTSPSSALNRQTRSHSTRSRPWPTFRSAFPKSTNRTRTVSSSLAGCKTLSRAKRSSVPSTCSRSTTPTRLPIPSSTSIRARRLSASHRASCPRMCKGLLIRPSRSTGQSITRQESRTSLSKRRFTERYLKSCGCRTRTRSSRRSWMLSNLK
jgi:hypothetical protein